jgi:hypothetical protein
MTTRSDVQYNDDILVNRSFQQNQERALFIFFSCTMDSDHNIIHAASNRNEDRGLDDEEEGFDDSESHCSSESNLGRCPPISASNIARHAHEQEQHQYNPQQHVHLESTFPINAMHYPQYVSETQRARSDVATVCSGSVLEDIEVESVISQEDNESSRLQQHPLQQQQQQHQDVAAGNFDDEYQNRAATLTCQTISSTNDVSELEYGFDRNGQNQRGHRYFESNAERSRAASSHVDKTNETFDYDHVPVFSSTLSSIALLLASENPLNSYGMGPPLSRSLLLDRGLSNHHHHGSDSGSLPECETRSNVSSSYNQDYDSMQPAYTFNSSNANEKVNDEFDETAVEKVVRLRIHDSHSQSGSVKSYGSCNTGGDTDDCGGSLDVETHSIETKSIYSQDDVAMAVTDNPSNTSATTACGTTSLMMARLEENAETENEISCSLSKERHDARKRTGEHKSFDTNSIMMQQLIHHNANSDHIDQPSKNDSHYQWSFMHQTGHDYDPRRSHNDIMHSRWEKGQRTHEHSVSSLDGVTVTANDVAETDNSSHHKNPENIRGRRSGRENDRQQERSRSRDREDEKMPSR